MPIKRLSILEEIPNKRIEKICIKVPPK